MQAYVLAVLYGGGTIVVGHPLTSKVTMRNCLILVAALTLPACGSGSDDDQYVVGEWTATIQSTSASCGGFPAFDAHFYVDELQPGQMTFTDVAWTDVTSYATFDGRYINVVVDNDPTSDPQLHIELEFYDLGNGAVDVDGTVRLRGTAYPGGCAELLDGFGVHYPQ